ncbi:MAG: polysaccharide biosynthesis C-terminal domain-containing protein [Candidatus Omnitrophica bacterium]|nr:polysaccharide biosynthesis C-terminal domain-containing protein [Candidatus Omnitrophota bacterium]
MALARGFNKAFRILAVISVFFVIVSMSCASSIIHLIYGRAFVDAVLPFQILLPAAIFLFLHPLLSFVLIANDRQDLLIPASAGALIVNFVLDIVLIPGYGSAGASIASLAGYAVLFGVTFYFVNRHVVKVSLLKRV